MHIRFAPIVPIALTLLLTACAGYAPQQSLTQTQPPVVQTSVDEPSTEQMAELTDDESYELPSLADSMLAHGLSLVGTRYRPGGTSVQSGFDCSGLIVYSAQRSLGLKLPPRADDIAKFGDNVSKKDLQVGDLVFFNTLGTRYSHVGVYLGQDKFVHSPTRGSVVRIEDMTQRYWTARYTGARRLDPTLLASR